MMRSSSGGNWGFSLLAATGRSIQDGVVDERRRAPRKGLSTGRHPVKHRAEAEQVRAGINLLAPRLLGRHVIHGAHRHPRLGERVLRVAGSVTIDIRHRDACSFARPKSRILG